MAAHLRHIVRDDDLGDISSHNLNANVLGQVHVHIQLHVVVQVQKVLKAVLLLSMTVRYKAPNVKTCLTAASLRVLQARLCGTSRVRCGILRLLPAKFSLQANVLLTPVALAQEVMMHSTGNVSTWSEAMLSALTGTSSSSSTPKMLSHCAWVKSSVSSVRGALARSSYSSSLLSLSSSANHPSGSHHFHF